MNPIFFNNIWRMDWGLGNPNKTAALIATAMVAVWALAYFRKWGFWVALTLFTGLGICLMHTMSRGGLVAAVIGLIPVIVFAPRPWDRKRLLAVVISFWVIVGASVYLSAATRFTQGVVQQDRSISNRFDLWKAAPQMMVDAPGGWGIGHSGSAFVQWYQAVDRNEAYRTLVNSHLTWLVELGWPLRFCYIAAWLLVLTLCWPTSRWMSAALGTWLAFAVAAWFSSVAESPWLWILPALLLLAVLTHRVLVASWPQRNAWLIPLGAAAAITLTLFLLGGSGSAIQLEGERVAVGRTTGPRAFVLINKKVIGETYPRTLRRFLAEGHQADLVLVQSLPSVEELEGCTLVIPGELPQAETATLEAALPKLERLILASTTIYPQQLKITPELAGKIEVIYGEFSNASAARAWEGLAKTRFIEGVGDFLPDWPAMFFKQENS